MTDAVFPRIQRTLAQVLDLPVDRVRPDTDQQSVPGWDSLHHVHLISAIESGCGAGSGIVTFLHRAYNQIIGNSGAPFENQLANQCGLATNYSAASHP